MARYSVLAVLQGHEKSLKRMVLDLEDISHWDRTDEEEARREAILDIYQTELDWVSRLIEGIKTSKLCLKRGSEDKAYLDIIS